MRPWSPDPPFRQVEVGDLRGQQLEPAVVPDVGILCERERAQIVQRLEVLECARGDPAAAELWRG